MGSQETEENICNTERHISLIYKIHSIRELGPSPPLLQSLSSCEPKISLGDFLIHRFSTLSTHWKQLRSFKRILMHGSHPEILVYLV